MQLPHQLDRHRHQYRFETGGVCSVSKTKFGYSALLGKSQEFRQRLAREINVLNLPTLLCEPNRIATLAPGQVNYFSRLANFFNYWLAIFLDETICVFGVDEIINVVLGIPV